MPPQPTEQAPQPPKAERIANGAQFLRRLGATALQHMRNAKERVVDAVRPPDFIGESRRESRERRRGQETVTPTERLQSAINHTLGHTSDKRGGAWERLGHTAEANVAVTRTASMLGMVRDEVRITRYDDTKRPYHEYVTMTTTARGAPPKLVHSRVPYADVERAEYELAYIKQRHGLRSDATVAAQAARDGMLFGAGSHAGEVTMPTANMVNMIISGATMAPVNYYAPGENSSARATAPVS